MTIVDRVYSTDSVGSYAIADLSTAIGYMIGPIIGTVVAKYATLYWTVVGFGGTVLLLSPLSFVVKKYTKPHQPSIETSSPPSPVPMTRDPMPISFSTPYNATVIGYGTSPLRTSRLGLNHERYVRNRAPTSGNFVEKPIDDF